MKKKILEIFLVTVSSVLLCSCSQVDAAKEKLSSAFSTDTNEKINKVEDASSVSSSDISLKLPDLNSYITDLGDFKDTDVNWAGIAVQVFTDPETGKQWLLFFDESSHKLVGVGER